MEVLKHDFKKHLVIKPNYQLSKNINEINVNAKNLHDHTCT